MEELNLLKEEFDQWRENKPFKHSAIPKDLWLKAIKLSKKLGVTEVAKACQLPTSKIKKKIKDSERKNQKINFVKASLPHPKAEVIELKTPSGVTLKIYS